MFSSGLFKSRCEQQISSQPIANKIHFTLPRVVLVVSKTFHLWCGPIGRETRKMSVRERKRKRSGGVEGII